VVFAVGVERPIIKNELESRMSDEIAQHYEKASLVERLKSALAETKLSEKRLSSEDLAALDQFHSRGLAATKELAEVLKINRADYVIDIGSGLGGPSRYLAEKFGCRVRGVDLSQSFVDASNFLAQRSELDGLVSYQQGNALSLPFPDGTFDVALTQHVAMNIADRAALYKEASRVLRSGARFGIYDVVAVSGAPLRYPVPWAQTKESSFLITAEEMRTVLAGQGFRVASWVDSSAGGVSWFLERKARPAESSALGIQVVMGPEFQVMTGNLLRNLQEDRVGLVQAVCVKA
jgi:ubiquinone/menaquinone biosynthesis C-methylase UbiE